MNQKPSFKETFAAWLPLAVTIIIFGGLAYALVQQSYRMNANDPQIQIAEDITEAINSGAVTPDSIVSMDPTADTGKSLSPFVSIYSATGTPVGSSVQLDGNIAVPPATVLSAVKEKGSSNVTWEPKAGVRVAAVIMSFAGPEPGSVLAGRLLREVEAQALQAMYISIAATILALIVSFLAVMYALKSRLGGNSGETKAATPAAPAV